MSALTLSLLEHVVACLVPRRHYSAWSIRNGSRGPSEPSSETSPKCINREGLEQRRIRIIGNVVARLFVTQTFISVDEIPWSHQTTPLRTIYFWRFYKRKVDFLFCGRGGGGGVLQWKGWGYTIFTYKYLLMFRTALFTSLLILLFTSTNFETFLYWRTRTIT